MCERPVLTANVLFSGIGCQERGIFNGNKFDLKVLATSDIKKEAILTYAAMHCGLTEEVVDIYTDYPPTEEMIKELTGKNIGYNPDTRTFFDWSKYKNKPRVLKKYWLAVHLSGNLGDICRIRNLPYADLWTSSFPCTDISCSGKLKGLKPDSNTRSSLLWQTIRLLEAAKKEGTLPKFVLFENVKNLTGKKFIKDFEALIEVLENLGFYVHWKVANAKNYGVPQNRERVFVFCVNKSLGDKGFDMPERELAVYLDDIADKDADEKYYLDTDRSNKLLAALAYRSNSLGQFFDSTDSLEYVRCVAMRGRYKDNPSLRISGLPTEQRLEIGPCDGRISTAITTVQKDSLILERKIAIKSAYRYRYHTEDFFEYRVRKQTIREMFLLMGLTEEDAAKAKAVGVSDCSLVDQVGNGIVTNCVEALFDFVYDAYYAKE